MTEGIRGEATGQRGFFDLSPARAIIGKRICGVLIKTRKADTKHPGNRMFLMFDDGSGYEFFSDGDVFPWEFHRDCDYKHDVRRRTESGKYATRFFAGEPEGDEKKIDLDTLLKQRKVTKHPENGYDKSKVVVVLGRCIRGLRLQERTHTGPRILDFIFTDGTVFEFRVVGRFFSCWKPESFDLYRLLRRGQNAYENEVLVLKDPDSDDCAVVINKLYKWPDVGEETDSK